MIIVVHCKVLLYIYIVIGIESFSNTCNIKFILHGSKLISIDSDQKYFDKPGGTRFLVNSSKLYPIDVLNNLLFTVQYFKENKTVKMSDTLIVRRRQVFPI